MTKKHYKYETRSRWSVPCCDRFDMLSVKWGKKDGGGAEFIYKSRKLKNIIFTSQRVKVPIKILVSGLLVKAVDTFKLLGITIDNKLNFEKYSKDLKLIIKIIQHKTFILPLYQSHNTIFQNFNLTVFRLLSISRHLFPKINNKKIK